MKTFVYTSQPTAFQAKAYVSACYLFCEGKILLLKRAAHKPQGETWGVPAGKIEAGEDPKEAAIREAFEEVSVRLTHLNSLGQLFVVHPDLHFVFHLFHQNFDAFPSISLSDEHTEFVWVTPEEASRLPLIGGGLDSLNFVVDALS
jgi:8-oxo-dGTP pyrophosphatase MutT (NUDIX family)